MTSTTLARPAGDAPWGAISAVTIGAWFAVILAIASQDGYVLGPGRPPVPLLLSVAVPAGVFLTAYASLAGFRRFILALDIRTVTAVQHWRVAGMLFLALLAFGQLPGLFAWPAGLGDVAVGLAALWVTHRLLKDPRTVAGGGFLAFHLAGIFDFVVAFATGLLSRDAALTGGVTTAPMGELPLIMIPAFLVPMFVIFHLIAILHWRHARRG